MIEQTLPSGDRQRRFAGLNGVVLGDGAMTFVVGELYTRKEIFGRLSLPTEQNGGAWFTGHVEHEGAHYIFCGVQTIGRTGHDYDNRIIGDDLLWHARSGSRLNQPSIQALISPVAVVRVFYRQSDRAPFTYAGQAKADRTWDENPVGVLWSFSDDPDPHHEFLSEEVSSGQPVSEGARKTITVNIYERDPTARKRCLDRWKARCEVCGFDFRSKYGPLGEGFIHIHHFKPLSEIGVEYVLDPERDLRPVCPNCHAMLHRRRPTLTIEELKDILRRYDR